MIRRLVAPAVLVGVLAACGGGSDEPSTPAAGSTSSDPAVTAEPSPSATTSATDATTDGADTVAAVPPALQFTAPLVGGGEIEMATLAGRPVLLWFWAPW